jgi:hypothetical protein
MTTDDHVFDDLPGLLGGELDRAATGRVTAHLRACDDCRQDLVLVATAAAALRSADRFAPQAVVDLGEELPDPSWFLAELAAAEGAPVEEVPTRDPDPADGRLDTAARLDTLTRSDTLTGARPDGGARPAAPPTRTVPGRSRRRTWWSAAAAAVLLLVGIGAGVLISRGTDPTSAGRQVALQSVGSWRAGGTMTMNGDTMTVDPAGLAPPPDGHFYEVWLVNRNGATPKMVSVGLLGPGGTSWTLPPSLLSAYTTVEVSFEPDDGNPAYSGDSVLRGQYS